MAMRFSIGGATSTFTPSGKPIALQLFPGLAGLDGSEVEARALVVAGVEPQQLAEDSGGGVAVPQSPGTEAHAVQAAQARAVVDEAPREDAIELLAERERADAQADLVVALRFGGRAVEHEVAQVRVGVEAAQVSREQLHQDLPAIRAGSSGRGLTDDERIRGERDWLWAAASSARSCWSSVFAPATMRANGVPGVVVTVGLATTVISAAVPDLLASGHDSLRASARPWATSTPRARGDAIHGL